MSQINLPSDNQFTDPNGRLLPQWRPVLQAAARLSKLNQSQLDKLIALLQDDSGFLGAGGSGGVGDILYRGDSGWLTRSVGDDGDVLTVVDGLPQFAPGESLSGLFVIDSASLAGATEVNLDGKGVACSAHIIEIKDIVSNAGNNPIEMQVAAGAPVGLGATIDVAAFQVVAPATMTSEMISAAAYRVAMAHPTLPAYVTVRVQNPLENGPFKTATWNGHMRNNRWNSGYGVIRETQPLRGYRFAPNPTLTFFSGTATLYGVA